MKYLLKTNAEFFKLVQDTNFPSVIRGSRDENIFNIIIQKKSK